MQTARAIQLHATPDTSYEYSYPSGLQVNIPGQFLGQPDSYHSSPRKTRQIPVLVRTNKALLTLLVASWSILFVGYGFDVAASNDVSKLQDQARRLGEQNTELSARLLKVVSFQGIQDSTLGRFGLRVPEQVLIIKEIPSYHVPKTSPQKHHLPLIPGF
jgi:hypothetical protein